MKCECCGATLGMFKKYVALSDGAICKKCFEGLGFDFNDADKYSGAKVREIQSGFGHYSKFIANKDPMTVLEDLGLPTLRFAHYGEERAVDAEDGEMQMFNIICEMVNEIGFDTEQLRLTRKSKDYVSAVIGDYDVARMKFTDRAKWIIIPYAEPKAEKHHIEMPDDVRQLKDLLIKNLEFISKYQE